MKSRTTLKYLSLRNLYQAQFPGAYHFLSTVEIDQASDLWVGTAVNAHLYKGDAFLAYICLPSPTTLVFSPHYHMKIFQGTHDCSARLFPDVMRGLLEKHHPGGKGWWRSLAGGRFELTNGAPDVVFNEILQTIREL